MSDKILVLVDVQNVYYTTRQAFGCNFDYNKFWQRVSSQGRIEKAIAYAIGRGDNKQNEFQNILRAIGFEVKLKPFIQRADGSAKGDWDVGISIDAIDHADAVDKVVIVSGDGDFDLLVDYLRTKKGKAVEVFGVEALTANSLIKAADVFSPIDEALLL